MTPTLRDQIQEKIKPLKVVALFEGQSSSFEDELIVLVQCPPQTRTIFTANKFNEYSLKSYRLDFPSSLMCFRIRNQPAGPIHPADNRRVNWTRGFYLLGFDGELQRESKLYSFVLPNGGGNGCICLGDDSPKDIPDIGEFVLETISYFWQSEFEPIGTKWIFENIKCWEQSKEHQKWFIYKDMELFLTSNFPAPIPESLLRQLS